MKTQNIKVNEKCPHCDNKTLELNFESKLICTTWNCHKKVLGDLTIDAEEIEELESKIDDQNDTIEELQSDIDDKNDKINDLEIDLKEANDKLKSIENIVILARENQPVNEVIEKIWDLI